MAAISKKASKRARRRQLQQADRKALYDHKKLRAVAKHLSRPVDPLPALARLLIREPFYLPDLGLTRECQGDCPGWGELPPVIYRRDR